MRKHHFQWLGLACLGIVLVGCDNSSLAQSNVVGVAADDATMNNAIARANQTLPVFWTKLASHASDETNFALKVKVTDGDRVEHFWCGPVTGNAQSATCTIDDDPALVKTVHKGQVVKVDPTAISDWMYIKGDKIKGGETIRALLPTLPADEAEALRKRLD